MILVDATPLQSEHRLRGVGSYLRSLLSTRVFQRDNMSFFVSSQGREFITALPGKRVTLPRPHQPAQVYWLYNEVALRYALNKVRPSVFFAPDFNGLVKNPYGHCVAVLHDLTAAKLTQPAQTLSEKLSEWRWRVYYRKLKTASHIITISEAVKQDALHLLGLDAERITVVHHGVNHEVFRPSHKAGTYAHHAPYFIHLGGFNTNKNQVKVLEAFTQFAVHYPEVQLYFAGPWSERDKTWLKETVTAKGLASSVRHLGYVPDRDLPSLFGNALAFVFPSLEEGFGLPVLEAMACGAPVITSNQSSLPEVAGNAALLVNPNDAATISEAITRVYENTNLREHLRQAGLAHAAAFTWEKTAERTLEVLEEALCD
jgi:glycosyltransferase involved in cell wall biosynthesis